VDCATGVKRSATRLEFVESPSWIALRAAMGANESLCFLKHNIFVFHDFRRIVVIFENTFSVLSPIQGSLYMAVTGKNRDGAGKKIRDLKPEIFNSAKFAELKLPGDLTDEIFVRYTNRCNLVSLQV
jgi:hypothetical protein